MLEREAGKVEGMLIGSTVGIMTPISGLYRIERLRPFLLLIDCGTPWSKMR